MNILMGMQDKIVKQMVFPGRLAKLIEGKAKRFGVSFAEYLRHLAIKDIETDEYEILDEETEKEVGKALEDYRKGNYITLKTKKDIDDFYLNLADSVKKDE
ncbi:hypothetical protein HYV12_01625 [Candidatus Dojkabacteria bacterium]|nr:hypothetical protein [Candidatus Dojkabacteria bacterium]